MSSPRSAPCLTPSLLTVLGRGSGWPGGRGQGWLDGQAEVLNGMQLPTSSGGRTPMLGAISESVS